MKTYLTGESFGELALMYNSPRAATIRCSKSGILYGLDRQTFINIVQQLAQNKSKYMK
jgi:cAMP-dependent protein kinase regulator